MSTSAPAPDRQTMNGKPVLFRPAKTVLNMDSGFKEKLLCDGPTFSLGDACTYSCSFCFVVAMMAKAGYMPKGRRHIDMVVRRENALKILHSQLLTNPGKGKPRQPKYNDPNDQRVVYSSPLVDCAGNMDLVRETVEACVLILLLTNWHIRLLSKSNLLPKLAALLVNHTPSQAWRSDVRRRMIFGVSTGTLDDSQAAAFEKGCAKPSKRFESLHWLQDEGFRTFGMICPSLPQRDYSGWAAEMHCALRGHNCEHIWAEVMNVRGQSLSNTVSALHHAGYEWQASALQRVSEDPAAWEDYARQTFLAHAQYHHNQPERLRFLQYVTPKTLDWWKSHAASGAILLGAAAHA
ncbi:MAG: hypothetical protein J0L73_28560 [Verrucomicrobia bacterium]|nr:hypothetical protein [Verrucomicrobiota bacterium]